MQTTKNRSSKIVHARFAHPAHNVVALGIQPGMKIADFGSGSGAYVLSIAEALCGSGHVYAVDIQRDLLRRTRNESQNRGFRNVEIVWGDLERMGGSKIADGALDMVLISNLLFQVMDKNVVIAEALRVLRPQGRVAIIDWSDSFGGTGPIEQDVVSKETALALAAKAGLELVKEFSAGAHHYGLIFCRKR
ncbi:methyltransferase domain-containing protein [Candidatus Uhrbacteria bacterium]|nr:methyltransferase domain-containing protein [Candidatus Uhrbacteria bacterium]